MTKYDFGTASFHADIFLDRDGVSLDVMLARFPEHPVLSFHWDYDEILKLMDEEIREDPEEFQLEGAHEWRLAASKLTELADAIRKKVREYE